MRTSVIMPIYNAERFLRQAIDSVIAQTDTDWQLILVDDGSTDSSPDICKEYAAIDSRIITVRVPNGGLSYARNRGLEKANGEWITFIDSDDLLHPQALKILCQTANHYHCDIVGAKHSCGIEPNFNTITSLNIQIFEPIQAIATTLYQKNGMVNSACGKLFRRSLFDNSTFSEGLYYEDLDIFYRLYEQANRIATTDAQLYFYRQHGESFIHKWTPHRLDVLTVVDRLEAYMAEHHPTLLPAARDRKLSANFNIYNLATINGEKQIANRCWQTIRQYRAADFLNPHIRLKNRLGIALSYLGRRIYSLFI